MILAAGLAVAVGCKQSEGELGKATARTASDTEALRDAETAAGRVIRAQGDCDAVKAALSETNQKLDEIAPHVKTAAGKATFEATRGQVRNIAQACGL